MSDELRLEYVPIESLALDPANPRRISERELEALTASIHEFGFAQPVLARREDRIVIAGHQRLLAARRLGLDTVPVTFVDLPVEQGRLLGLALNKISGDWDDQLLARLLADLSHAPDLDISLSGFSDEETAKLLRSLEQREKRQRIESFDLESALDAIDAVPTTIQCGDLFALGPNRLLCGDSTKGEDVDQLMAAHIAQMAVCDPPYNVSLGEHGGQQPGQKRRKLANDSLQRDEWLSFLRGWISYLPYLR